MPAFFGFGPVPHDQRYDGLIVLGGKPENSGPVGGDEGERRLVRFDVRRRLLFPTALGEFAAIEGEHGGEVDWHVGVEPVAKRRAFASAHRMVLRHRKAAGLVRLEVLRRGGCACFPFGGRLGGPVLEAGASAGDIHLLAHAHGGQRKIFAGF